MLLLERDAEVRRLSAAIAGARDDGRGAVVVVEGAAGLGKTRLLRHARSLASGLTVLSASGSELEHEFAFGVVRQLFERAPSSLDGILEAHGDRFAALHGLYWLVANLADERPLLLLVDDAQWADDPSLRFLAFLARRVAELGVVLLIAARPPLPGEDRTVLDTIAAAATTLSPAPLSEAAVATLAGPGADPALIAAIHTATAGNALLVEELLAEARETAQASGAPRSDAAVEAASRGMPAASVSGFGGAWRCASGGSARPRRHWRRRSRCSGTGRSSWSRRDSRAWARTRRAARPRTSSPPTCSRTTGSCGSGTR